MSKHFDKGYHHVYGDWCHVWELFGVIRIAKSTNRFRILIDIKKLC